MNWVKLHPTNISQKVQIIIEHFRENVGWRLDGKAKAMVVKSSRKAAMRYKLAFDKYVAENGYTDVAALVALSGEVADDESGLEKVTETSMNPGLKSPDLRTAFATDSTTIAARVGASNRPDCAAIEHLWLHSECGPVFVMHDHYGSRIHDGHRKHRKARCVNVFEARRRDLLGATDRQLIVELFGSRPGWSGAVRIP